MLNNIGYSTTNWKERTCREPFVWNRECLSLPWYELYGGLFTHSHSYFSRAERMNINANAAAAWKSESKLAEVWFEGTKNLDCLFDELKIGLTQARHSGLFCERIFCMCVLFVIILNFLGNMWITGESW